MGSVLIVTNQIETGKHISTKLQLLRDCDTVKIVPYKEVVSVLNTSCPSLILLYCTQNESISIIKEIRSINTLNKVPILFIMDTLYQEKLFFAFDNGIDDFVFLDEPDSVILMRVFLNLQKSLLNKQIEINNDILISANIIDKQTGIYVKEQAPLVLRHFFSKNIEENLENTVFMYLRPIPFENETLNTFKISKTIKSLLRANDIIAYGNNSGYYLILYNTTPEGAGAVITRIQNKLADECKIFGAACEVKSDFEELEPVLNKSINQQLEDDIAFKYIENLNIIQEITLTEIKDESGKDFNEFKREFLNAFEKIVSPIFYQIQTANTYKFKDSEIKYYINTTESKFYIKQGELTSELIITYPSYLKVIIDIKHHETKNPSLVKRYTYDFDDFSQEKLNMLLKEMLNEYSNRLSLNTIKDETE